MGKVKGVGDQEVNRRRGWSQHRVGFAGSKAEESSVGGGTVVGAGLPLQGFSWRRRIWKPETDWQSDGLDQRVQKTWT